MANYPKPKGWSGPSQDGSILRQSDGRLGINEDSDPEFASDLEARSNVKSFEESDYGGEYS